jgi:hypothetical protein
MVIKTKHNMPKKLTVEEFIARSNQIHNNLYDYSKTEYIDFKHKVKVICKIHGEFICNPGDHIYNKSKCQKCSGMGYINNPLDYFIERSKITHNNLYDYGKFEYVTAKSKSIIKCKIHGDFLQHPNAHLNGQGCPSCRSSKISSTRIKSNTDEDIFQKLLEIHSHKYIYPPQEPIGRNIKHKLKIICPTHGEFHQSYHNHYYGGNGCEKCGNNRLSKGEKRIEEFLFEKNIIHEREHKFDNCINPLTGKKLLFDFYLIEKNVLIEYQGKQHYEDSDFFKMRSGDCKLIQERDKIKKQYCIENNIKLIVIPYTKFNQITKILSNEI